MELIETIKSRRSIRKFKTDSVPDQNPSQRPRLPLDELIIQSI